MLLKDLLDKESDDKDKDVNIILNPGVFSSVAQQVQNILFPINPLNVLLNLNRKSIMKKKDKFTSLIFLSSKDIKEHTRIDEGPFRYVIKLFHRAWREAYDNLETSNIYLNKAIVNPMYHIVDIYFGVRGDDDEKWERDKRLGKINTPYYKVRIVYPDKYELYDVWSNITWSEDGEYYGEYAIYDSDNFEYTISLREKEENWIPLIGDEEDVNSYPVPDTYEESNEDYEDDGDDDDDN